METTQPTMIGHFLTEDDKRSIKEFLDKSKGPMTTLPTASTIVNVFPGDLRDWFAGQASAGLLANRHYFGHFSDAIPWNRIASEIYELADAMLAARETKK